MLKIKNCKKLLCLRLIKKFIGTKTYRNADSYTTKKEFSKSV